MKQPASLALATLSLLLCAQASAQSSEDIYAGALLGSTLDLQRWDLQEDPDGADGPRLFSAQLGLRGGYWPSRFVGGELEWSYLPTGSELGDGVNHAMSWRLSAVGTPLPEAKFSPFLSAGVGLYHNVAGSRGRDADMRFDYGVGVKTAARERIDVRFDLRHVITDGVGEYALANNLEPSISVDYRFGDEGAAIEQPEPSDLDADGVIDTVDACPDVAGVDALQGCPDADGDSVADAEDSCPEIAGVPALRGCPDADGDGIDDARDRCPEQRGDAAEEGCPDSDGDGLVDLDDRCPREAEDLDRFEDDDGCPEPDNDLDKIVDAQDQCPDDAELVNGFEDEDGCPEPDQDKDGIVDALDKCPTEPETYNGNDDDDGCPDGRETVLVTDTEVRIFEKIFFEPGKATIKAKSFALLDTVYNALEQHPRVTSVRVEGHTDDVGDAKLNEELSARRAESVRQYLIDKGIDPDRLTARGYGSSAPLCDEIPELMADKAGNAKAIEACRAENRRVQFQVTTINNKPVAPLDEAPAPATP